MANRIGGYPKDNGRVLADGHGNALGHGRKIGCTRIRPGAPGSWISNERCSYQFIVAGKPYSCRGYGDGVAVSCREMKKAPKGLAGARRRGFRDGAPAAAPSTPTAPTAPVATKTGTGRARRRCRR